MIRTFLLRILAVLAHLIAKAQDALSVAHAEAEFAASQVAIEVLRDGVAIADDVVAAVGNVAVVERRIAKTLIERGHARRV